MAYANKKGQYHIIKALTEVALYSKIRFLNASKIINLNVLVHCSFNTVKEDALEHITDDMVYQKKYIKEQQEILELMIENRLELIATEESTCQ